MAISDTIDNIMEMRVMDVPVGKAFMFTASKGLTDGLVGIVNRFVPAGLNLGTLQPLLIGGLVAWMAKMGFAQDFLGRNLSELMSVTAGMSAIDTTLQVSTRIQGFISGLGVGAPPPITPALGLGAPMRHHFAAPAMAAFGAPSFMPAAPMPEFGAPMRPRLANSAPAPAALIPEVAMGQPRISPGRPETPAARKIRLNIS